MEHSELKTQGKAQGFLRYAPPLRNEYKLLIWWEEYCFSQEEPAVHVLDSPSGKSTFKMDLPPARRFTPMAYDQLPKLLKRYADSFSTCARSVCIEVESDRIDFLRNELLALYQEDGTEQRQKEMSSYWARPLEGMARCLNAEGLDAALQEGDLVYVREIPNMPDHCIVLKNGCNPLVGYHLDRFELLYPYE